MKRFTNAEKVEHAIKLLTRNPKCLTVRGKISTRKAAYAVHMSHVTLGRSKRWKAALDDYENTRPDTGGNQAGMSGDSDRMDTSRA